MTDFERSHEFCTTWLVDHFCVNVATRTIEREPGTDAVPPLVAAKRISNVAARLLLWVLFEGADRSQVQVPLSTIDHARLLGLVGTDEKVSETIRRAKRSLIDKGVLARSPPATVRTVSRLTSGFTTDGEPNVEGLPAWLAKLLVPAFKVPMTFWANGWANGLDPAASIALFIEIYRSYVPGESHRHRERRFGVSDDLWAKGCTELLDHGILTERTPLNRPRRYDLHLDILGTPYQAPRPRSRPGGAR